MPFASPCRLTPSTMPSSVHCIFILSFRGASETSEPGIHTPRIGGNHETRVMDSGLGATAPSRNDRVLLLRKLEAHGAVALRVLAPALAHLHKEEQVHLVLDDLSNIAPR